MKIKLLKILSRFCGKTLIPYFSVGDNVGLTTKTNLFEKSFTPRWTEEVFTINQINLTIPITYKITDLNGEEIEGSFYDQELQKAALDTFRIEKVLKRRDTSLVRLSRLLKLYYLYKIIKIIKVILSHLNLGLIQK